MFVKRRKKNVVLARKESPDSLVVGDAECSVLDLVKPDDTDVEEILSLHIPTLLEQAAKLHGTMKSWTTYVADCKKVYQITKLGRDTAFANAKEEARTYLKDNALPCSNDAVEVRARRQSEFQDLSYDVIRIERELDVAKGIVNAIYTKREMCRSMLFAVNSEERVAALDFTVDDCDEV